MAGLSSLRGVIHSSPMGQSSLAFWETEILTMAFKTALLAKPNS